MFISPDLTTPDLTAKPDLQALFIGPTEKSRPILKALVYNFKKLIVVFVEHRGTFVCPSI